MQMGNFPASAPTERNTSGAETLNAAGTVGTSGLLNEFSEDIVALAAKVGTGASTPDNNKVLKSDSAGTSLWAAVDLTTDVTGTLPVANGGTGVTTSTGTGNTVLSSSPTIVTPTIASFANANHDHTNSAGGGTLGANTVDSDQYVDGSIDTVHVADSAITAAKRSGGFYIGQISSATLSTTGNKAVTGVGFTPKLVRFALASTSTASSAAGYGAMTSSAQWYSSHAAAAAGARAAGTDACFMGINTSGTEDLEGAYVSMDADGFTINVVNGSATWAVSYECYG
jgi:hypothetical protein